MMWGAAQSFSLCMQDAIQEKKKVLAEKAATLRQTLGRSKREALDPLDDSSLSRSAKVHIVPSSIVIDSLTIMVDAYARV